MCTLPAAEKSLLKYSYTKLILATLDQQVSARRSSRNWLYMRLCNENNDPYLYQYHRLCNCFFPMLSCSIASWTSTMLNCVIVCNVKTPQLILFCSDWCQLIHCFILKLWVKKISFFQCSKSLCRRKKVMKKKKKKLRKSPAYNPLLDWSFFFFFLKKILSMDRIQEISQPDLRILDSGNNPSRFSLPMINRVKPDTIGSVTCYPVNFNYYPTLWYCFPSRT